MASVKQRLRELSYREASPDDMNEFLQQVSHETNDRGACILMATNTEIALTHAIFRVLKWDDIPEDGWCRTKDLWPRFLGENSFRTRVAHLWPRDAS